MTPSSPSTSRRWKYPETRREAVTDDYHGTRIEDPYRWLEESGDPEVRTWVDAQNALFRVQGFQEKLKEEPGMELVASQTGHWTTAGAMQAMENILQANPDLNAVFSSSDMMGVGAVEALSAAGKLDDVTLVPLTGYPMGSTSSSRVSVTATSLSSQPRWGR